MVKKKEKHGFIRTLWGIYEHKGRRLFKRRSKIDSDIKLVMHNKHNAPFRVYVYGQDNYNYLIDFGFDCKLINKKPILWDMDKQQYRHKLEAFKRGLQDFEEIVFLDWDCQPIRPLPKNFWETMAKKEKIQATLNCYHRRKAHWRKEDMRKVPCAEFVYIRGIEVANEMIELWRNMKKPWSEETVMARYTDLLMGDKFDLEEYWQRFEPEYFVLNREVYGVERCNKEKNIAFQHFHMKNVPHILKQIKRGNIKPEFAKIFK